MNIVIVNDFGQINGGAGKVAYTEAIELSRKGINVTVLTATKPVANELLEAGVNVVCTEQQDILNDPNKLRAFFQGLWNFKSARELKRLLDDKSIHETIVHFHGWTKALSPSLFKVTKEWGGNICITTHEYFLLCPNGGLYNYNNCRICHTKPGGIACFVTNCDSRSYPQKIWRFIRLKIQGAVLWRNRISAITISKTTNRLLSPLFKRQRVNVFPLRNPTSLMSSSETTQGSHDTFLFIGRLSREKGADLFCEAISNTGLKGTIIGDGYMKAELEKKYPNITFEGWLTQSDIADELRCAKSIVFPSRWYEGAPLTVIESLSAGIPCIVPDECAASEEIVDGVNGFKFKIGDVQSLESAIRKCDSYDFSKLNRQVSSLLNREQWSIPAHIDGLISVYNKILHIS